MTNSEKNFYKKRTKDNLHFSLRGISYKNRMFQGEKHEKTNGNTDSGCTDCMLYRRCSQQEASADLTPVRLNEVVHSVFYAPQYVAQELGFFEEEGLDVTVSVGNGADKSMTALLSDSAGYRPFGY